MDAAKFTTPPPSPTHRTNKPGLLQLLGGKKEPSKQQPKIHRNTSQLIPVCAGIMKHGNETNDTPLPKHPTDLPLPFFLPLMKRPLDSTPPEISGASLYPLRLPIPVRFPLLQPLAHLLLYLLSPAQQPLRRRRADDKNGLVSSPPLPRASTRARETGLVHIHVLRPLVIAEPPSRAGYALIRRRRAVLFTENQRGGTVGKSFSRHPPCLRLDSAPRAASPAPVRRQPPQPVLCAASSPATPAAI